MDMKSKLQQYYDHLKINCLFCLAIFGNKKYLRFDEDHEKLLTCLELSDIEGCNNEDDDSENGNGIADGIREENVEDNLISMLKTSMKRALKRIWKFSQINLIQKRTFR
ncbi:hypothetical protein JTB14_029466 [Gonioctena quinquepunctata]|nr:hypothetical protein JTB14_029466 [Gonioctena quinquepunctata]